MTKQPMNDWIERNQGHIIVLLLSLILNGGLVLLLLRPPANEIKIVPRTPKPPKTTVRVFVSGAVIAPDVYELPIDSLVQDAIKAAGGHSPEADLNQINLARQLKDQEQIFVPYRVAEPEPSEGAQPVPVATPGKINLNTATAADLESLPHIGPTLAPEIIEFRAENGSFSAPEDIKNVYGIGDTTYEQIKDRIMVN